MWIFWRAFRPIRLIGAALLLTLLSVSLQTTPFPVTGQNFILPFGLLVPMIQGVLLSRLAFAPSERLLAQSNRLLWPRTFALLMIGLGLVCGAALAISPIAFGLQLVRNAIAFTALTIIGNILVGKKIGWVLPIVSATLPPFLFSSASADTVGVLTFFAQPSGNVNAWLYAGGLLTVAVAAHYAYLLRVRRFAIFERPQST